ncbi:ATP-grasp domain-containing protein [Brevibacterium sp. 'Marine']|uniref:ATP-grasp domain-containing protein n=1 Tax=Brevibacterium sp. 'Marine' TaxID=2725563 RepID=UPI00145F26B5|nr:ATP-grasp domain-containing protein [Brevibacterium sp. 'Marine']
MTVKPETIVISSAGRRLYLIDWFREAFEALGIEGRVIIAENDPTSSSASYGDVGRCLPKYDDPDYGPELMRLVAEFDAKIFVSANDYELMHVHVNSGLANSLRESGVLVPGVSAAWQAGCADKLQMAKMLGAIEVPTPATVSGADEQGIDGLSAQTDELVVKHRFGSGSSGLRVVSTDQVRQAVTEAALSAPAASGHPGTRDDVVVQPKLPGTEYGVDIIGSLTDSGMLSGVLARRKVRMRAGETDKAVTVDAAPFTRISEQIAGASDLTGLIDVDVFVDDFGERFVIDINPRFGGGYPFVHLAGADVPLYYLAQALGVDIGDSWSRYELDVVSAKYESIRVTG